MKDATKEGLHVKEKEFFTAEEERKFWEMNLLGTSSVEPLHTVHFYSVFLQLTSLYNAALYVGNFQNCNFVR